MGAIQGSNLFYWLNTNRKTENNQPQVLDAQEIQQAKDWGFSLFELKENMTYQDFEEAYQGYVENHEDLNELNSQEYNIHVKHLQKQYGVDIEPNEGEDFEAFEARLEALGFVKTPKLEFGIDSRENNSPQP